jgi:hypothetical protein
VLEHSAFSCRGATLLNPAAEPLVVIDRAGQQVERHLVRRAASLRGEPRQLRYPAVQLGGKNTDMIFMTSASFPALPRAITVTSVEVGR